MALLLAAPLARSADNPYYTSASVVNAATSLAGPFAPNTIISIYGKALARDTVAISKSDLTNGSLPLELSGVKVIIGGRSAGLYYISPTQINALIPNSLLPGVTTLVSVRNGLAGPILPLTLTAAAPGFFTDSSALIATHATGELISSTSPALASEWLVLYCEGLGRIPSLDNGEVASRAYSIVNGQDLSVLIDGVPLPARSIYYAGVTPGFAGLYHNPEVRVAIGPQVSPPATFLHAQ
jgi:uncharacterized protein (TIGR03437 family)